MSKSIVKTYNPVSRVVKDGGVWHAGTHYADIALSAYEGCEVLLDPTIDIDKNCFSGFEVYEASGQMICTFVWEEDDV